MMIEFLGWLLLYQKLEVWDEGRVTYLVSNKKYSNCKPPKNFMLVFFPVKITFFPTISV